MKSRAEILLLSCYELGHMPHGLALTTAFLERAGFRVTANDLAVDRLDADALSAARFVGISVPMHTALRIGVEGARRARQLNPDAHICFYGLYAGLNREYLLGGIADSVVAGEHEAALCDLAGEVLAGSSPRTEAGPVLEKLAFPVPSRDSLPSLERYAQLQVGDQLHSVAYTEASRGCLHSCRHCPIPPVYQGRFFAIPQEVVIADIAQQVRRGARHVTFGDPDFLNGPQHARRIATDLHREFPDVSFDATVKIEHIVARGVPYFADLAAAGLLFVVSAVESLNDKVLQVLDKGHNRTDVDKALAILDEAGVALRPSFVPFTPWETLESYIELLDWVAERDLVEHVDPVHYAIRLLVPPGSLLTTNLDMTPHLGTLSRENFSFEWRHPDPRMDELQAVLAAAVESATTTERPVKETFRGVRRLAYQAAGSEPTVRPPAQQRPLPPKLTESWFC